MERKRIITTGEETEIHSSYLLPGDLNGDAVSVSYAAWYAESFCLKSTDIIGEKIYKNIVRNTEELSDGRYF